MTPTLHIAVVSYRTDAACHLCIDSIQRSTRVAHRLTVVDTSENRSLNSVRGGFELLQPGNVGYAAALNLAFARAEAPFLLALNADVELPRQGIAPLLKLMRDNPKVGVIGPRQVNHEGRIAHAGIDVLGDTLGGRGFRNVDIGQFKEPLRDVAQVSGSVMLIRRSALEECDGVPVPAFLYFEDAALCRRMRELGWRVAYSGLVTFLHAIALSPDPPHASRAELAAEAAHAFKEG